jgi:hypothetical protein
LDSFLIDMTNFGEKRGGIAHSGQWHSKTQINPENERNAVNALVAHIKKIDACFEELLHPIMN